MANDPTNVNGLLGLDFDREAVLTRSFGSDPYAAQRAQGAKWGTAAGALLGGLFGGYQEKKAGGSFLEGYGQSVKEITKSEENRRIASVLNITPEALEERENLRTKISQYKPKASDPLEAQIETLAHAAASASDPDIKKRIADQIAVLKKQHAELAKLDRDEEADLFKQEVLEEGPVVNITRKSDGQVISAKIDPRTGIATTGEGTLALSEYGVGDLSKDPGKTKTLGERLNKVMPSNEQRAMREMVNGTRDSVRMYGKVLSNIRDSIENDGGVSWLGRQAQATYTFADQWTRQISNVARVAGIENPFTEDTEKKYQGHAGQVRFMRDKVEEAGSGKWNSFIPLPAGWEENSAAAQRYRSNIMQLAYMEARQREPTNRGLSDKDIESALIQLGADSANPAVILRNFTEKVTGQARKFNDTLQTMPRMEGYPLDPTGTFQPAVADAIMGGGWEALQEELRSFRRDFDFTADVYGRTEFGPNAPTGGNADVQPGQGTNPKAPAAGAGQDIDPEVLKLLQGG